VERTASDWLSARVSTPPRIPNARACSRGVAGARERAKEGENRRVRHIQRERERKRGVRTRARGDSTLSLSSGALSHAACDQPLILSPPPSATFYSSSVSRWSSSFSPSASLSLSLFPPLVSFYHTFRDSFSPPYSEAASPSKFAGALSRPSPADTTTRSFD